MLMFKLASMIETLPLGTSAKMHLPFFGDATKPAIKKFTETSRDGRAQSCRDKHQTLYSLLQATGFS